MTEKQWCFEPFDTLFFRESRPLDTISGTELSSLFPPPARTVVGAIRSLIGENRQINGERRPIVWKNYLESDEYQNIRDEIGGANDDDFGQLELQGPFLIRKEQRLYPVPLSLMEKDNHFYCLQIGKQVHCDLGEKVRLPKLAKEVKGAKPLDKAWLTKCGLKKVLCGELPHCSEVIRQSELFKYESRLGIVRDRQTRATQEGLLYQTQQLRLCCEDIKIGAIVKGISADLQPNTKQVTRFGGEGRLASVEITDELPPTVTPENHSQNLFLMLLTPAYLGWKKDNWLPAPNFQRDESGECTVWKGKINGVALKIISAVLGKPIREGGWNLRKHCPRPLKSLVPAGSVWFCQVEGNLDNAIKGLNGYHIHDGTESGYKEAQGLGRGELIVGIWK